MTYGQMRWTADALGVTVSSAILPPGFAGVYDDETETILIDRRMTYRQKRCALVHELVHWKHGDIACTPKLKSKNESRTRIETARMLIHPETYATAERIYDADPFSIADELEVTMQVIDDYRRILHYTME